MPEYELLNSNYFDTSNLIGGSTYRIDLSRVNPSSRNITPTIPGEEILKENSISGGYTVPHVATFAYRYNQYARAYWWEFDEALRYSQQTSLAMRRDPFIHELLRHRQLPVVSLPDFVAPEDPDNIYQKKTCEEIERVINKIPRFQAMKLSLKEGDFYGKGGVQTKWGHKKVLGRSRYLPLSFLPVNGDKIRHRWDGTPGILVRDDADLLDDYIRDRLVPLDIGKVLWLEEEELRSKFVIYEFEPSDTDYMFEGDMAQSVHGLGLRSRLFWAWNMRQELLGYYLDALQRIGANGMLFGFYKTGSPEAQKRMLDALWMLSRENIAAFETDAAQGNLKDIIQTIPPSQVGYENIFSMIQHLEEIMRRAVLGQNLSSQSAPTGFNSAGVAELQADVYNTVIRYDAISLGETLDNDLFQTILKYNFFNYKGKVIRGTDLPFTPKYGLRIDKKESVQKLQMAQMLISVGVTLDKNELRDLAGFRAPEDEKSAVPSQEMLMGAGGGAQQALAMLSQQQSEENNTDDIQEDTQEDTQI